MRDGKNEGAAGGWEEGGGVVDLFLCTAKCIFSPEYDLHPVVTLRTYTSMCKKVS